MSLRSGSLSIDKLFAVRPLFVRWPRIVWHLTNTEQVELSTPKPAANADGSLKRKSDLCRLKMFLSLAPGGRT